MMYQRAAFGRLEDAIEAVRLSSHRKAALWLLVWSLRDPALQRQDVRLMAAAFGLIELLRFAHTTAGNRCTVLRVLVLGVRTLGASLDVTEGGACATRRAAGVARSDGGAGPLRLKALLDRPAAASLFD
jgi:hypothetical protein